MSLKRVLETEVMDTPEEARDYNNRELRNDDSMDWKKKYEDKISRRTLGERSLRTYPFHIRKSSTRLFFIVI